MSKKKTLVAEIDVDCSSNPAKPLSTINLATTVLRSCVESKGIDLTALDVTKAFGLSDYFIVVSGRSDRHVQGLVNRVINDLIEQGIEPLGIEGYDTGHWIILDLGEVVLHAFYEPVREIYDIEGLWCSAPRIEVERSVKSGDVHLKAA